ncbi:MAG TPA: hypothetical protein VE907_13970 [Gammaproteobacteria bacterium]|nr:hypothetical protein [Gammaproteobacteria bacterium]
MDRRSPESAGGDVAPADATARADARGDEIAAAILAYLEANRRAADAVNGVTEYWLRPAGIEALPEEVEAVLQRLAVQGLIEVRRFLSGRALYSHRERGVLGRLRALIRVPRESGRTR